MEHKSHKVRIHRLDSQKKPLYRLTTRSKRAIISSWVLAFLLMCARYYILMIPVFFFALVMSFASSKKIFEGYDNYFIVYHENDVEYCDVYYVSEIKSWEYQKRNDRDCVNLVLVNSDKVRIDWNMEIGVYRYFNRVMPELQYRKEK